jgi:hypothetical protein
MFWEFRLTGFVFIVPQASLLAPVQDLKYFKFVTGRVKMGHSGAGQNGPLL